MSTDDDDDVIPHLQCDIELNLSGPNFATINKWVADALRKSADRIENDELETGVHPVTTTLANPLERATLTILERSFDAQWTER